MKRDELDKLKARTLHLDCTSIELRNHDGSRTYSGPGYIRQREPAGFEFTVFVAQRMEMKDAFARILAPGLCPGVLIPHAHYWSMTATDMCGRKWTAERIPHPSPSGSVDASAHTVGGEMAELIMTEGKQRATALARCHMRAFGTVRFPRNQFSKTTIAIGQTKSGESSKLNVAQFSGSGFKFELLEEDGETILHAESETQTLHPFFESRVSESLLFALGTQISWSVIEHFQEGVTTTKLRTPERLLRQPASLSPVAFSQVENSVVVWRLFERYLAYVWPDTESFFHRLSGLVLALIRSADGSIEAEALTAAVEVESVLSGFFESVAVQDDSATRQIDELLIHLKAFPGDAKLIERAVGSVSQLKSIRPGDRLRELVRQNAISEANFAAWRKLRNSVAHGDWSGVENLQSFIDQKGRVQVLFYQLVFHLIGYAGKHTDWGQHGWPLADYPTQEQP